MDESKRKFPLVFFMAGGYGAFIYSVSEKDKVIEYVKNQKEHHQIEPFYDGYKRLLIKNGIEFDEKYLV